MNKASKQLIFFYVLLLSNDVCAKRVVQASAYYSLQKKDVTIASGNTSQTKQTSKAQEVASEPLDVLFQDTSFAHEVGDIVVGDDGTTVFTFTKDPAKEWGICYLDVMHNDFSAYVHGENIFFNNESQEEHPLEKHVVKKMTLIQKPGMLFGIDAKPLVVLDDGSLCLFTRYDSAYKLEHLQDSLQNNTTNIISLQGTDRDRAYVAVAPKDKKWGDLGSCINVIGTAEVEYKKISDKGEAQIAKKIILKNLPVVAPLTKHSSTIKINKSVQSIGDNVIFAYFTDLQRLYIGCNEVVVNSDDSGARSIALGYHRIYDKQVDEGSFVTVQENNLTIGSIFHTDVDLMQLGNNHVIATMQKDSVLSVHNIATMTASTNRDYLVVRGGHGTLAQTTNCVYALPIVSQKDGCGLIADKDNHMIVAKSVQQLPTTNDAAVCVGGKTLNIGKVSHMFVRNDAVFVSVTDAGDKNGIFSSQAVFNAVGDIKGWTSWQRVCLTSDEIYAATINPENSSLVYFTYDDNDKRTVVKSTAWGTGDKDLSASLINCVNKLFCDTPSGVIDCAYIQQNDSTTFVLTGTNKVVCMDEGSCLGGNEPMYQLFEKDNFSDIASLSCSTILLHDDISTLFVAGYRGLVMYNDEQFVSVGDYHDVYQLLTDNNSLYVISTERVDRIDIDKNRNLTTTTLATTDTFAEFKVFFRNMLLVDSVMILGTSKGLFVHSNNAWHQIDLPEGAENVADMYYVASALKHDVGGNLYVLTSSISKKLAYVHRLSVDFVQDDGYKNTTISLFHDIFIEGKPSYFVSFGYCKDKFTTDGATTWITNRTNMHLKASLSATSGHYFPMRGRRNFGKRLRKVLEKDEIVRISRILKSTVTGSWLVTGNFGMYACE